MALSHDIAATYFDRVLAADGLYYGFYGFRYAG
jgi:hypothetical protein